MRILNANILQRVFKVEIGASSQASGFTIERGGRQWFVTCRHVSSACGEVIRVSNLLGSFDIPNETINGLSAGPDIAVLPLEVPISTEFETVVGVNDLYLSQQAFFLGFPKDLEGGPGIPFLKGALISSLPFDHQKEWYLDGYNFEGFSGGPVVTVDEQSQVPSIRAVVARKLLMPAMRKEAGGDFRNDDSLFESKGIVGVWSIKPALEAIDLHITKFCW